MSQIMLLFAFKMKIYDFSFATFRHFLRHLALDGNIQTIPVVMYF